MITNLSWAFHGVEGKDEIGFWTGQVATRLLNAPTDHILTLNNAPVLSIVQKLQLGRIGKKISSDSPLTEASQNPSLWDKVRSSTSQTIKTLGQKWDSVRGKKEELQPDSPAQENTYPDFARTTDVLPAPSFQDKLWSFLPKWTRNQLEKMRACTWKSAYIFFSDLFEKNGGCLTPLHLEWIQEENFYWFTRKLENRIWPVTKDYKALAKVGRSVLQRWDHNDQKEERDPVSILDSEIVKASQMAWSELQSQDALLFSEVQSWLREELKDRFFTPCPVFSLKLLKEEGETHRFAWAFSSKAEGLFFVSVDKGVVSWYAPLENYHVHVTMNNMRPCDEEVLKWLCRATMQSSAQVFVQKFSDEANKDTHRWRHRKWSELSS